jgi:hypothetical protein
LYSVWSLMDAKLYLLGYWWHHWICYTGLFTTPRVVITISPYNESWPSDVLSRSGPWISSVLSAGCWLTGWPLLADWLFVTDSDSKCPPPWNRFLTYRVGDTLSKGKFSSVIQVVVTGITFVNIRCSDNNYLRSRCLEIPTIRSLFVVAETIIEPLPGNGRCCPGNQLLIWLHSSSFQTACYSMFAKCNDFFVTVKFL